MIEVFIPGHPAPQGSKDFKGRNPKTGKAIISESSKFVGPWRESIRARLITDKGQPIGRIAGPVVTVLEYVMHRPGYLCTPGYLKGKKSTPPMDKIPDMDKLERATNDAMKSAGVYEDDARINLTFKGKRYAEIGEPEGLRIQLFSFDHEAWPLLDMVRDRLVEIESQGLKLEAA